MATNFDFEAESYVYIACQRYLCPNVIPMTVNVCIFRNLSLKTVFVKPYVKINYSLSLSLTLGLVWGVSVHIVMLSVGPTISNMQN